MVKEEKYWIFSRDLSLSKFSLKMYAYVVAFQLYDQDKDGKISRQELLQVSAHEYSL